MFVAAFCGLDVAHGLYIEMLLMIEKYLSMKIEVIVDNIRW